MSKGDTMSSNTDSKKRAYSSSSTPLSLDDDNDHSTRISASMTIAASSDDFAVENGSLSRDTNLKLNVNNNINGNSNTLYTSKEAEERSKAKIRRLNDAIQLQKQKSEEKVKFYQSNVQKRAEIKLLEKQESVLGRQLGVHKKMLNLLLKQKDSSASVKDSIQKKKIQKMKDIRNVQKQLNDVKQRYLKLQQELHQPKQEVDENVNSEHGGKTEECNEGEISAEDEKKEKQDSIEKKRVHADEAVAKTYDEYDEELDYEDDSE